MSVLRLATIWSATLLLAGVVFLGLSLAATTAFISDHMGSDGPIGWPPIQCGRPCVIEEDHGGIIDLYVAEARIMAAGHVPLIVDGPCISACTLFVDIDRANVCMTTNAVFGYHKSARMGPEGILIFGPISYDTPGLNAYIVAHGGLPDPDSGHLLMLGFNELTKFYRPCAGAA